MPSLCVFGKPYIRGLCDPVGRIASYIHFGTRSALTKSSNLFLKARFKAGCVVIAGDRTKSSKYLMIFTRGQSQLSANAVESTRRLAIVQIHVERVIRLSRIRKFAL